jgi:hypothetical protein
MAAFSTEGGSLTRGLSRFESEHQEDWLPAIVNAQAVLASLSPDKLRGLGENEIQDLIALRARVDRVLEDRARLTQDGANG